MSAENQKTTETTVSSPTPRYVTVVTTRGETKKIEFGGTNWSELKRELENSDYNLNNMKCVESIKRTTLEHPKAVVPDGDFSLFLMPYKSKSGGEARDKVKAFSQENKQAVKDHFGNWTVKKEDELVSLLKTYKHKLGKAVPTKEAPAKKEASKPVPVVEAVPEANKPVAVAISFESVLADAKKLSQQDQFRLAKAISDSFPVEVKVDKTKVTEQEKQNLLAEMRNIANDLDDVRF